jgi:hypothetical protein
MDGINKINMLTTVCKIFSSSYSPSFFSILHTFTDIFLFCSQPIKEKRIFIEYKSNMHNNMLWFHGYVFSVRETENS